MKKNICFKLLISIFTLTSYTSKLNVHIKIVNCKWRTIVNVGGIPHYSEWTYGNCDDSSAKLIPIK